MTVKLIIDTNVLLDFFAVSCTEDNFRSAKSLITELSKREQLFLVTPSILRDFHYLFCSRLKAETRAKNGTVTSSEVATIQTLCLASIESITSLGTIASEDLGTCEMARVLCKTHPDYEDNLLSAVALRVDATAIVTRDASFAKHSPVLCCTPEQALRHIQNGVWA